jgi:hypothetical protein
MNANPNSAAFFAWHRSRAALEELICASERWLTPSLICGETLASLPNSFSVQRLIDENHRRVASLQAQLERLAELRTMSPASEPSGEGGYFDVQLARKGRTPPPTEATIRYAVNHFVNTRGLTLSAAIACVKRGFPNFQDEIDRALGIAVSSEKMVDQP